MPTFIKTTQYIEKVEPVFFGPETVTESRWHQPFSEPVRFRIDKKLAIALIVSGITYTFPTDFKETVTESRWHQPFTEPVRTKPRLHAALNPFFFAEVFNLTQHETSIESKYHQPWSEPIRLNFQKSIFAAAQKAWTGPDRYLPPANVTMIMAATETEDDVALASVSVYNQQPVPVSGAATRVSIYEIKVDISQVSIREG